MRYQSWSCASYLAILCQEFRIEGRIDDEVVHFREGKRNERGRCGNERMIECLLWHGTKPSDPLDSGFLARFGLKAC